MKHKDILDCTKIKTLFKIEVRCVQILTTSFWTIYHHGQIYHFGQARGINTDDLAWVKGTEECKRMLQLPSHFTYIQKGGGKCNCKRRTVGKCPLFFSATHFGQGCSTCWNGLQAALPIGSLQLPCCYWSRLVRHEGNLTGIHFQSGWKEGWENVWGRNKWNQHSVVCGKAVRISPLRCEGREGRGLCKEREGRSKVVKKKHRAAWSAILLPNSLIQRFETGFSSLKTTNAKSRIYFLVFAGTKSTCFWPPWDHRADTIWWGILGSKNSRKFPMCARDINLICINQHWRHGFVEPIHASDLWASFGLDAPRHLWALFDFQGRHT